MLQKSAVFIKKRGQKRKIPQICANLRKKTAVFCTAVLTFFYQTQP
jgi:hypothetical protein